LGRILAIDYGQRRCGLAMTDPLNLFATPLETVKRRMLVSRLLELKEEYHIQKIVIGLPLHPMGEEVELEPSIQALIKGIRKKLPEVEIDRQNESYSSAEALELMIKMGVKRSKRSKKENLDKMAAAIILQRYLGNV